MKRLFVPILAVLLASGCCCQQTTSGVDPFFGYTRIAPPPTGSISGQSADPYYMGAPASSTAPPYSMAPPAGAPGPITPGSAAPLQPGWQSSSGAGTQPYSTQPYSNSSGQTPAGAATTPSPGAGTPPSSGVYTQPPSTTGGPPSSTAAPAPTNSTSPSTNTAPPVGSGAPATPSGGSQYAPPGGNFNYQGTSIPGATTSSALFSSTRVPPPSYAQQSPRDMPVPPPTTSASPRSADDAAAQMARRESVVQVLQPRPVAAVNSAPTSVRPSALPYPSVEPRRLQTSAPAVDIMQLPAVGTSTSTSTSAAATPLAAASNDSGIRPVSATDSDRQSAVVAAVAAEPADAIAEFSPAAKYGHDSQYRWLRGKLEHSQIDGCWKLRYIPVDGTTDDFGGSVVLADPKVLSGCERGEFVEVRGKVSDGPTKEGYAPTYEVAELKRAGQ